MRRFTKLISAVLMLAIVATTLLCFPMNTMALTDGDWEFKLLDNKVKITDYHGTDKNIVVPEMIYGCPVTELEDIGMFENAVSVSFPSGIKKIVSVFGGYSGSDTLETVILSEGTEEIGYGAFQNCKNLKNINLPSTIKNVGESAFFGCKSLTSIDLPASLTEIGKEAFYGTGIQSIDLSKSNIRIGGYAFGHCENLKNVKFHPELTGISGSLFRGCKNLEEIDIPASVTVIYEDAFRDCVNLKQIVLPINLKNLWSGVFRNCDSLTEIIIPAGTEKVGGGAITAFSECDKLQSVYIPDSVKELGGGKFLVPDNCIVYCGSGSYTEEYCKEFEVSYLTDISVNSGVTVIYNGKRISFHSYAQNPEILEGRTLVPLRSIFEAMGAEVEWDGNTRTATATRKDVTVKIQIGANEIYKNGTPIPVDVPAQIINDRTMVPVRVISEAFGADVQWNGNGRTVFITE